MKHYAGLDVSLDETSVCIVATLRSSMFLAEERSSPDMSLQEIFSAVWPFVGLQIIGLIAIILMPEIALWLPRVMN